MEIGMGERERERERERETGDVPVRIEVVYKITGKLQESLSKCSAAHPKIAL